jgi:hypothetical protein
MRKRGQPQSGDGFYFVAAEMPMLAAILILQNGFLYEALCRNI